MLVKHGLGVIRDPITEFGLRVSVCFASTTENKADCMSKVPKGHCEMCQFDAEVTAALSTGESMKDALTVRSTSEKQIKGDLLWKQVKLELARCQACQRVDPTLRSENFVAKASLSVEGNWHRVAIDVTHYEGRLILSMVNGGPSRFAFGCKQSQRVT